MDQAGAARRADRDGGSRADVLGSDEREELRRLRRDILAKAAARFAASDATSRRSANS